MGLTRVPRVIDDGLRRRRKMAGGRSAGNKRKVSRKGIAPIKHRLDTSLVVICVIGRATFTNAPFYNGRVTLGSRVTLLVPPPTTLARVTLHTR